jgi:hypothetical protein
MGPSADPLGTIRDLIERGDESPVGGILSWMWSTIILRGTEDVEVEDLPSVSGIAQYAGRKRVHDRLDVAPFPDERLERLLAGIEAIVVGSPFFVAQSA